jgi:hypothetical protein
LRVGFPQQRPAKKIPLKNLRGGVGTGAPKK